MSPGFIFSRNSIMDAVTNTGPTTIAWIAAIASAAVLIPLLAIWLLPDISQLKSWLRVAPRSSNATKKAAAIPPDTASNSDSGYEGSQPDSDHEDDSRSTTPSAPHCDGAIEEDESNENYDLHRAIRLCQETATPKRAPSSPYSEDFEVFTSFLSATEKKTKRFRDVD
ncbi:hypothetical protein PRZ48_012541 [Zasmidium cellare]|uniref:Uncharacterized protein n=1 Tax=Zasmidium cellare TaxID=395010 RepID=A0ABR0E565_ZASCE|nr:hypothetical protein PRZ48_012541 [Zasmidium cellare]